MIIEVNLSKGNFFVAIAMLVILLGGFVVYATIVTTQPHHDANHVIMADERTMKEAVTEIEMRISNLESSEG